MIPSYAKTPTDTAKAFCKAIQIKAYDTLGEFFTSSALKEFRAIMRVNDIPDENASMILPLFFGPGATKESVKNVSDEDFFNVVMSMAMKQSALSGGPNFRNAEYLGEKRTGDLVQVLLRYDVSMQGREIKQLEPLALKKEGDEWKLLLNHKIKSMITQMRASLGS